MRSVPSVALQLQTSGRALANDAPFYIVLPHGPPLLISRAPKSPAVPSAPLDSLEPVIHTIRGERVILDSDLARLYGVETKVFKQAVRRNREKFPPDFMFELTLAEAEKLRRSRSQIVTLQRGENIKHAPFAFTEHGALMTANVLNSAAAIQMSVFVTRAFIKMRSLLTTDTRELANKLLVPPPKGHPRHEPLRFAAGPRLAA